MKNVFLAFILIFDVGSLSLATPVIPKVKLLTSLSEAKLILPENLTYSVVGTPHPSIDSGISRLSSRMSVQAHRSFISLPTNESAALIQFEVLMVGKPDRFVDESYSLSITTDPSRISIRAPTHIGALRAIETLAQMFEKMGDTLQLDSVRVEDRPDRPWRGLMIDVARKFHEVDLIKRHLIAMAAVKLNVFHLHLTDNEGFRFESKRHPLLHQFGSGGKYYSQSEIRDIVSFAENLGIRVVPEIGVPGQISSWLVGYPELGTKPGPYTLPVTWQPNLLDPTKESTFVFIESLLQEVGQLFPDEYLHVGAEEDRFDQWMASPHVRQFMVDRGFKTVFDLNRYFMGRVFEILARLGKKPAVWNQALLSQLPSNPNLLVMPWNLPSDIKSAASQGFRVSRSHGFYVNSILKIEDIYGLRAAPAFLNLTAEENARVVGAEVSIWMDSTSMVNSEQRLWPLAAAVAENLWNGPALGGLRSYLPRSVQLSKTLENAGVRHRIAVEESLRRFFETDFEPAVPRSFAFFCPFGRSLDEAPHLSDMLPAQSVEFVSAKVKVQNWLMYKHESGPVGEVTQLAEQVLSDLELLEKIFVRRKMLEHARLVANSREAVKMFQVVISLGSTNGMISTARRASIEDRVRAAANSGIGLRFRFGDLVLEALNSIKTELEHSGPERVILF